MGIVNASPDSFSDGGRHPTLEARRSQLAERAAATPAPTSLDIGGESATTGRPPVAVEQELERVVPLVERVAGELGAIVSVDTYKPAVARAAIAAGASIVNDVSGLRDPELADVCAQTGAALVVMHTRAAPRERLQDPDLYGDVTAEVLAFLRERIARGARRRACAPEQLIVDPGPDFAKTPAQTIRLLVRARAPARAGPPAADGDLAQGLHRGADRPRAARAARRHARARSRTGSTRARTSSACTTSPLPRTSSPCAPRSPAPAEPSRDLALADELRHDRPTG